MAELPQTPRREERPRFAEHVKCVYDFPRLVDEDGEPVPQRIDLLCEKCSVTHQVICNSGHVRTHMMNFAIVHLHKE